MGEGVWPPFTSFRAELIAAAATSSVPALTRRSTVKRGEKKDPPLLASEAAKQRRRIQRRLRFGRSSRVGKSVRGAPSRCQGNYGLQ